MKTMINELALVWDQLCIGDWTEKTYRHRAPKRIIMLTWKRFEMPTAKQRNMQITPVLPSIPCQRLYRGYLMSIKLSPHLLSATAEIFESIWRLPSECMSLFRKIDSMPRCICSGLWKPRRFIGLLKMFTYH